MEGSNIERNWSPELQPLLQSAGTSVHQGEEDLPPGLVKAKPKNVFLSRSLAIPALVITLAFFFTILMGVRFLVRLNPHVGPHALELPFGVDFTAWMAFAIVFAFRYFRLLVNCVGWCTYQAAAESPSPQYQSQNVAVIIPTTDKNEDLINCVRSIIKNQPKRISVVTVGEPKQIEICKFLQEQLPGVSISSDLAPTGQNDHNESSTSQEELPEVSISSDLAPTGQNDHNESSASVKVYHYDNEKGSKREQIIVAVKKHKAENLVQEGRHITALVDASVEWPTTFLASALAPFEQESTWLVGTVKRVERSSGLGFFKGFWNHIGCLYLERHNWEIRAQNSLFGDDWVISGRTCLIRTEILQHRGFQYQYLNEYLFNHSKERWRIGPLNADDDNMIDRWVKRRGGGIKFQYTDHARIKITGAVGKDWKRFAFAQCLRWARTTFRSNPRALGIARIWKYQPYSVYSIYLAYMLNFALLFDGFMLTLMWYSPPVHYRWWAMLILVFWIICTKMIKVATYYWQQPRDCMYFLGYVLFAYFHSFIKLWALLTFWDITWAGRNLNVPDEGNAAQVLGTALDREGVSSI